MSSRKSKLPVILGAFVVGLLGFNAYLLFNKLPTAEKALSAETTLREEAQQELANLETEYNATIAKLDEAIAENQEFASTIEKQKEELGKSKSRIQGLLNKGKTTQEELDRARALMASFTTEKNNYLAEIAALQRKNEGLVAQTKVLTTEKEVLSETVEEQRVIEEDLRKEKRGLEEVKEDLEIEKVALTEEKENFKSMASALKVNSIVTTPIKVKSNGEEKAVKFGKRADKMKVCFDVLENAAASNGPETIYLRLLNTAGQTLAIEALGSGEFKDMITGQPARFTISETIDYENAPTNMCMYWASDKGFEKGKYTVELYNKGYIMGRETILLK